MTRRPAYDATASAPMAAIVRVAVVAVTLALFFGSTLNALLGERDLAILFALATPLGLSAWGFARAGHNEAAMVLLCTVLVSVTTLVLVLNRLGVHDVAITAYGAVVLVGAALLSRRAFFAVLALTLAAATSAFALDFMGLSRSLIARHSGWPQYVELLVIIAVFATLGRVAAETLFGSLGEAHHAAELDPVTSLPNRRGFFAAADACLKGARAADRGAVLLVADLEGFRRVNLVVGHEAGDRLLAEAGRRVRAAAGEQLVARIGDDEFAVLGLGVPHGRAAAFAGEIHRALDFDFQGVSIRNAAGFARFPRDASGAESLLLAAEGSLARAKAGETGRLVGTADPI